MTDDVLRKILAGDDAAFTVLVREYLPEMKRKARRELDRNALLGETGSEDICQDVFVLFFERVGEGKIRLDDERHLRHLLLKMVHDDVVRQVRKERTARRSGCRREEVDVATIKVAAPPEQPLTDEAIEALVAEYLAALSADEALFYRTREARNLWPQVAAACNATADAARIHFARLIVKFREAMRRQSPW